MLLIFIFTWMVALVPGHLGYNLCETLFKKGPKGTVKECEQIESGILDPEGFYQSKKYTNLLILTDAHCSNDGSYNCKGLAGRFEFLFNTKTRKVLGPAPPSKHVNQYGFHERVPVAYNINGKVVYADTSINWAKQHRLSKSGTLNPKLNILQLKEFNWCLYAPNDLWPYKSAILSPDKKYHIYFYNRQTCIYDPVTKRRQHFNTRFMHNSSLRIDLDMNPTIFDMQEHHDNSIRMVKHHRQHWFEVKFKVHEGVGTRNYLIEMADKEEPPISIRNGLLLDHTSYSNFTKVCLDDYYSTREDKKNAHLVPARCGVDFIETADLPEPVWKKGGIKMLPYEVGVHNIPRWPEEVQDFYGVNVFNDVDWTRFASDGFIFIATTCIPTYGKPNVVDVYSLYAEYDKPGPSEKYDENYPINKVGVYSSAFDPETRDWTFDREKSNVAWRHFNVIDDIAYLPACDTLLVIFGPLYQEFPPDNFSLRYKTELESILDLDLWEPAHAFFADPDPKQNTLYVYHRLNWVQAISLKCGNKTSMVRGVKKGGYTPRSGPGRLPIFVKDDWASEARSEETFFQDLGVYKGNERPDAPDPRRFPLARGAQFVPEESASDTFIYVLVGIAVLLILGMCVACLVTMRRRRKDLLQVKAFSSAMGRTRRSNLSSSSGRSGLISTVRTGISGSSLSKSGSARRRPSTSLMSSRKGRSNLPSASTARRSSSGSGRNTVRSNSFRSARSAR